MTRHDLAGVVIIQDCAESSYRCKNELNDSSNEFKKIHSEVTTFTKVLWTNFNGTFILSISFVCMILPITTHAEDPEMVSKTPPPISGKKVTKNSGIKIMFLFLTPRLPQGIVSIIGRAILLPRFLFLFINALCIEGVVVETFRGAHLIGN